MIISAQSCVGVFLAGNCLPRSATLASTVVMGLCTPAGATKYRVRLSVLELLAGFFDESNIFEAAVKVLPKVLYWLHRDGWNGGSRR